MIHQDTICLLRECDAGAKIGAKALEDVMPFAQDEGLKSTLKEAQSSHQRLAEEIKEQLHEYQDEGKSPSPMASGMSWLKTQTELALHPSDQTIADLMTDGCNMGVKSLSKYLNQYQAAERRSRALAARLIHAEEKLSQAMRAYL